MFYDKRADFNFAIINCSHYESEYINRSLVWSLYCPTHMLRSNLLFSFMLFTTVFWVLNYKVKNFLRIVPSYLSKCFSEDITLLKSILSLAYIWRDMILAIIVWFTVDSCFLIMSSHGLVRFAKTLNCCEWIMFYLCFMYIFTHTTVQHNFYIIWCIASNCYKWDGSSGPSDSSPFVR